MGAFGDPRFRRMFAGYALSSFGDSALYLTLGIWAKTLTGSNSAAGGVFLALAIPSLCAPLAGHLADRVRRKPLLITTNVLTAVLLLALLAVDSRSQLWIIYLVAFGYGVSFSVQSGANAGLRKDMLRGEELASANAALSSMGQGIRVLSPLAGAAIFAAVGGRWVAVLDVATFAAAIAALAGIRVRESEPEPPGTFWREVSAGVRQVCAVPLLAQLALTGAIAFSVIGLEETIVFAVIGQGLHRAPAFFGVLTSVQGAGSIAAGVVAAMLLRKTGPARMAGIALACFAVGSLALRTSSLPLVLAASVGDGLGVVWLSVGLLTAAQVHTPPRLQGRVGAALSLFLTGPQTVSIAVGAALISVVSYRLMLLVMAVVIGGCAAVLIARPAAEPDTEPDTEPAAAERETVS